MAGPLTVRQSKTILARSYEAHWGNYADDVDGATALGCREYGLRDLIAAVRALPLIAFLELEVAIRTTIG